MTIKFLVGRKLPPLFALVAVGILFNSARANGAITPLDKNDLSKITGACATCTKYVQPLICCFCTAGGGEGWNECTILYPIYECESAVSGTCTDSNKYAINTGASWAKRDVAPGRRCNNAPFCAVTNVKGVNYIGPSSCWCAYYGCN